MKLFAFLFLTSTAAVSAFTVGTMKQLTTKLMGSLPEAELRFERAVKCGEKYGLCPVEELLELADELEAFQEEAFFEDVAALQAKEVQDRKNLAEVLRLEAELALRHDYLKKANLFKADVNDAQDMRNRDEAMDTIMDYVE